MKSIIATTFESSTFQRETGRVRSSVIVPSANSDETRSAPKTAMRSGIRNTLPTPANVRVNIGPVSSFGLRFLERK